MNKKQINGLTSALFCLIFFNATTNIASAQNSLSQSKKDVRLLCAAVCKNPSDLKLRRMLVESLLAAGMSKRAAEEMQGLVKAGLRRPEDYSLLADSYRYCGKYASAIQYYQEALSISPDFSHARSGMALAYMQAGAAKLAESICKKAIAEASDLASLNELRGTLATIRDSQKVSVLALKVESNKI